MLRSPLKDGYDVRTMHEPLEHKGVQATTGDTYVLNRGGRRDYRKRVRPLRELQKIMSGPVERIDLFFKRTKDQMVDRLGIKQWIRAELSNLALWRLKPAKKIDADHFAEASSEVLQRICSTLRVSQTR